MEGLPVLWGMLAASPHAIGVAGECAVVRALRWGGYEVEASHPLRRGDVVASRGAKTWFIEVKTARASADGSFQFTLWKHWKGRLCTSHQRTDVVVALAVLETAQAVPYVIPTGLLLGHSKLKIGKPDKYKGKWAEFRQSMDAIRL
jgi:Holliday junction resolvase-like predicted endonuclease